MPRLRLRLGWGRTQGGIGLQLGWDEAKGQMLVKTQWPQGTPATAGSQWGRSALLPTLVDSYRLGRCQSRDPGRGSWVPPPTPSPYSRVPGSACPLTQLSLSGDNSHLPLHPAQGPWSGTKAWHLCPQLACTPGIWGAAPMLSSYPLLGLSLAQTGPDCLPCHAHYTLKCASTGDLGDVGTARGPKSCPHQCPLCLKKATGVGCGGTHL